jgi:hypothetical protein
MYAWLSRQWNEEWFLASLSVSSVQYFRGLQNPHVQYKKIGCGDSRSTISVTDQLYMECKHGNRRVLFGAYHRHSRDPHLSTQCKKMYVYQHRPIVPHFLMCCSTTFACGAGSRRVRTVTHWLGPSLYVFPLKERSRHSNPEFAFFFRARYSQ